MSCKIEQGQQARQGGGRDRRHGTGGGVSEGPKERTNGNFLTKRLEW